MQEVSLGSSPPHHELRLGQDRPWGSGAACRGGRRAECRATGQCREAGTRRGHGDGGGSARPALPGSRYWREDSPVRAGVAVKLPGRQAPGGSPHLHWPCTPTPAPPGRHRVHGSLRITPRDSGVPGGAQWQGQGRLGPQGVGAQESSPLRSAVGTQLSFRLGRPSGPREPGSRWWGGVPALGGGDPALGE